VEWNGFNPLNSTNLLLIAVAELIEDMVTSERVAD